MADLVIKDLHVSVENKEILKGLSLTVKSGERHALMGPNGNGKSTLLAAIMGNPKYTVTSGSITLDGKDVLQMSVDERSKAGLRNVLQYFLHYSMSLWNSMQGIAETLSLSICLQIILSITRRCGNCRIVESLRLEKTSKII